MNKKKKLRVKASIKEGISAQNANANQMRTAAPAVKKPIWKRG
jgi:hypothetical protein